MGELNPLQMLAHVCQRGTYAHRHIAAARIAPQLRGNAIDVMPKSLNLKTLFRLARVPVRGIGNMRAFRPKIWADDGAANSTRARMRARADRCGMGRGLVWRL